MGRAAQKLAVHIKVTHLSSLAPQPFHLPEPRSGGLLQDVGVRATVAQNAFHHGLEPTRTRAQAVSLLLSRSVTAAFHNQIELLGQFAQMQFTGKHSSTTLPADILILQTSHVEPFRPAS